MSSTPTTARSSTPRCAKPKTPCSNATGSTASKVEALVEIANRSFDSITDPARRDRYRVHVHVDVDNTMIDGLGYRLPDWLRDLICCDTIVSTVNEREWDPGQRRTHPAHRAGTHPPPRDPA